ncbi:hypothetical protein MP228_010000 [Amoeboaphelidium protococcarum]|nr:hypothetical protein MP228_010000 [Amoeboaphelidium protococcarum]
MLGNMVEMVEPRDKFIMSVFVKQILTPRIQALNGQHSVISGQYYHTQRSFGNGVIRLSNAALCSSLYTDFNNKPTCNELGNLIESMVAPEGQVIKQLDLSCNMLLSADVKLIRDTIEQYDASFADHFVLQLRRNQIQGVSTHQLEVRDEIMKLVNMGKLLCLDLAGNPFCTIDNQDFFVQFTIDTNLCKKLIWISECNLPTIGWRSMVNNAQVASQVQEYHYRYYSQLGRRDVFDDVFKP